MSYKIKLSILVFIIFFTCAETKAQQDQERFLIWLKNDITSVGQNLEARHFLTVGSFGVAVATLSLADESASRYMMEGYGHSKVLGFANEWGNKNIIFPVSAGIFATSLLTNNTKFQNAAFTSLQALLLTTITNRTVKFIFGRERPYEQEGAYQFDPMEGGDDNSFPSGHSGIAFALLTPWVMYYPNVITYSMMAIPTATAIARVARGKHWLSDVVTGSAIGFSIAYQLSKRHIGMQSNNIEVTPSITANTVTLGINVDF